MGQDGGAVRAKRVATVLEALRRYRDGGEGESGGVECLLARASAAGRDGGRRRAELIGRMTAQGMDRRLAAVVYDTALEEAVDPAFAFEVVRCGVGVCGPETETVEAPAVESTPPAWLEAGQAPRASRRERLLRASFRRLRHLLEEQPSAEDALIAFAYEPDVTECEY